MPRRKWETVSPDFILEKIKQAGFNEGNTLVTTTTRTEIEDLSERVKLLLSIANNTDRNRNNMLFFVMYDIESDKVRGLVAKYLIAQGCIRIQNSIFIADAPPERCQSIKKDLQAVQQSYQNEDSILVVPLSADNLSAMHIIGKTIDIDLITKGKSPIFF